MGQSDNLPRLAPRKTVTFASCPPPFELVGFRVRESISDGSYATTNRTVPERGAADYTFKGGFPAREKVQRGCDDADLCRAIEAYKFFYPSVSILAAWKNDEVFDGSWKPGDFEIVE